MAAGSVTASCSSSISYFKITASHRRNVPFSPPTRFLGLPLRPSHFLGSFRVFTSTSSSSKLFNSRHTNRRNLSVFAMASEGIYILYSCFINFFYKLNFPFFLVIMVYSLSKLLKF